VAALLTQELSIWRRFGSVRASAIVSLMFSLVLYIKPPHDMLLIMPAVAMGASFVAMSSRNVIPNRKWMAIAAVIFSIVFILTSPSLDGYGGVLGTGACVSVLTSIGLKRYLVFVKKKSTRR
jgi:hypothetical protein